MHTLDQIQLDALEVEEKFTSTGKWEGKVEYGDRRKGKEESCSLGYAKETQNQNLNYMSKLIMNLSNKLVKLELVNKNTP